MAWQRQPGQGAYARPELERRFLVAADPPPGEAVREVEDRYLTGTTLRLRLVTDGTATVRKLTQKVRLDGADPSRVSITNTYLTEAEHALLATLPAAVLRKTRCIVRVGAYAWVVDVHDSGLRLAELELTDLDAPLPLPDWVGAEVTHDDRYSGGRLAHDGGPATSKR